VSDAGFAFVFAIICFTPIGLVAGLAMADNYWRNNLVKSGHAEYYLDENNQKQWRMKK